MFSAAHEGGIAEMTAGDEGFRASALGVSHTE